MNFMVDIGFAQAGIFVILTAFCWAAFFIVRSHGKVLGWLCLALMLCFLETLFLTVTQSQRDGIIIVMILLAGAVFCLNLSISALIHNSRRYRWLDLLNVGLLVLAAALLYLPAPYIVQNIPFQLACALGFWKSAFLLLTVSKSKLHNILLAISIAFIGFIFFFRASFYFFIFPLEAKYYQVVNSVIANQLVMFVLLFSVIVVLLIITRVVTEVVGQHLSNAQKDVLTGLYNRAAFDQLVSEKARAGDALILCDLDNFKVVNDEFGHLAGDEVLRNFASILLGTDHIAGRFGGEEFALLIPKMGANKALSLAHNIRREFAAQWHEGIPIEHNVTASFGIAVFAQGETLTDVFRRADRSLYDAKRSGRNRVEIASPPVSFSSRQSAWTALSNRTSPIAQTGRPT